MTEVKICETLEQAHTLASRINKAIERLTPYTTTRKGKYYILSMPLHGIQEIAIARVFAEEQLDPDLAYRVIMNEKETLVYTTKIDIDNTCEVVTRDENNILHLYKVGFDGVDGYLIIGRYMLVPDFTTKNIKIL